ncbi:type II secretion system protein GspD [candidate division KSB3 bacterium]|uniref:Type II secretion system protein GspD n=1 Tax=candidate division KSB3 bacterium TaxID=2044937 RepID=A0A2G6KA57_9BACT|nr:MAG: type II secretion system protein GspD [candidate division KSB3 bacterium]
MMKRVCAIVSIVCVIFTGCTSHTLQQQPQPGQGDSVSQDVSAEQHTLQETLSQTTASESEEDAVAKIDKMIEALGVAPISPIHGPEDAGEIESRPRQTQADMTEVTPIPQGVVLQTQIVPEKGIFPAKQDDEPISVGLNFDNADIYDVTKVVSEITGKSFIIDETVSGTVTVFSETAMTPDQIFDLYETVLDLNGLAIVRVGDFYKIEEKDKAQKRFLIEDSGTRLSTDDRLVTQIVKLRYIQAEDVKTALSTLMPEATEGKDIVVYPDEDGDTLIITDLASNVKKILAIIDQIDISRYSDQYFEIFPIEHASLEDLVNDLTEILSLRKTIPESETVPEVQGTIEEGAEPEAEPQQPASRIVPPGTRTKLYPITRLNALVVSTNQADVVELVRKWVNILDHPSKIVEQDDPDEVKTYVYPVQYSTAEDLAPILVDVYAQETQPELPPPTVEEQADQGEQELPTIEQDLPSGGSAPVFIPDTTNNSIIIKATPRQYAEISSLLEDLDKRPLQVLIDVIFAEVELQDTDIFGVQGMLLGQGQVSAGGETNSVETTTETVFQSVFPNDGEGFRFVAAAPGRFLMQLRALATESKFKVLSDPHILVRHNEEATINIGDKIPISETTGTGDNLRQNVTYRTTGIVLTVTPRINTNGDVVMKIEQEVSDVGQESFGDTGAASFTTRNSKTSVVTKDNQPLIMGGLITDRGNESRQGVPLLKDIPGLGKLFRYDEKQSRRQELIILVTPRVVRDPDEGWTLTENVLADRIKRLEEFFNREDTDADKIRRYIKKPFSQ